MFNNKFNFDRSDRCKAAQDGDGAASLQAVCSSWKRKSVDDHGPEPRTTLHKRQNEVLTASARKEVLVFHGVQARMTSSRASA